MTAQVLWLTGVGIGDVMIGVHDLCVYKAELWCQVTGAFLWGGGS